MGKPKTQRTADLHNAARRYTVAKQVEVAIEQHNFDRLVKAGVVVRDTLLVNAKPGTGDKQIKDYYEQSMLKKDGGGARKATPRSAISTY